MGTLIVEHGLQFRFCLFFGAVFTQHAFSSASPYRFFLRNYLWKVLLLVWPRRLIFGEYLPLVVTSPHLSTLYFRFLFLSYIENFRIEEAIFYLKRRKLLLVFINKFRALGKKLWNFLLLAFLLEQILLSVLRALCWGKAEVVLLFVSRVKCDQSEIFYFIGSSCLVTSGSIDLLLLHLLY